MVQHTTILGFPAHQSSPQAFHDDQHPPTHQSSSQSCQAQPHLKKKVCLPFHGGLCFKNSFRIDAQEKEIIIDGGERREQAQQSHPIGKRREQAQQSRTIALDPTHSVLGGLVAPLSEVPLVAQSPHCSQKIPHTKLGRLKPTIDNQIQTTADP